MADAGPTIGGAVQAQQPRPGDTSPKGAQHFWQSLSDTIRRAVNLRIVTLIGDAKVTGDLTQLIVAAPDPTGTSSIVTDINLIGGDITQIISEKLMGADAAEVRAAHEAVVKQSQEIVTRNVQILVSVAKELGDKLQLLPPPSTGPARP
jgi:hypothetical protein